MTAVPPSSVPFHATSAKCHQSTASNTPLVLALITPAATKSNRAQEFKVGDSQALNLQRIWPLCFPQTPSSDIKTAIENLPTTITTSNTEYIVKEGIEYRLTLE